MIKIWCRLKRNWARWKGRISSCKIEWPLCRSSLNSISIITHRFIWSKSRDWRVNCKAIGMPSVISWKRWRKWRKARDLLWSHLKKLILLKYILINNPLGWVNLIHLKYNRNREIILDSVSQLPLTEGEIKKSFNHLRTQVYKQIQKLNKWWPQHQTEIKWSIFMNKIFQLIIDQLWRQETKIWLLTQRWGTLMVLTIILWRWWHTWTQFLIISNQWFLWILKETPSNL